MTEAILIDIAQRRRKLEDAIDSLDPTAEFIEDDFSGDDPPARQILETLAEACRDDMNDLMEFVRKGLG